jgi:uncharacterized protein YegL
MGFSLKGDDSGSLQTRAMGLEKGLTCLQQLLGSHPKQDSIMVSTTTFGPSVQKTEFKAANMWRPPPITPAGDTPLGQAIAESVMDLEQYLQWLNERSMFFNMPLLVLATDGISTREPPGVLDGAIARLLELCAGQDLMTIGITVTDADQERLRAMGIQIVKQIQREEDWLTVFEFVSRSVQLAASGQRVMEIEE